MLFLAQAAVIVGRSRHRDPDAKLRRRLAKRLGPASGGRVPEDAATESNPCVPGSGDVGCHHSHAFRIVDHHGGKPLDGRSHDDTGKRRIAELADQGIVSGRVKNEAVDLAARKLMVDVIDRLAAKRSMDQEIPAMHLTSVLQAGDNL